MYQSALVDSIVSLLNNPSPPAGTWNDYSVGTTTNDYIKAVPALDPDLMFESGEDRVLVVPSVVLYSRSASRGRQRIVSLNSGPSIAICMMLKFRGLKDPQGLDVADWPAVKKVLDLREDIDRRLLTYQWDLNITDILAEPAQELPLKQRWFFSVTEIQFEQFKCSV
jgi:hypothetical protein